MSFSLFCLFFFATWLLCLTFLRIGNAKRAKEGKDTSNKAGLAVCASIALGWILLQSATPSNLFPFNEFILGLYPFLIAMASLSMYVIYPNKIGRFWVYFAITGLSVIFLPIDWSMSQGFLPLFFDRFLTALLWALFICIYRRMDKINGLTIVQTSALCLAFSIFPFMTINRGIISDSFTTLSYYPMIVLAGIIAFMNYRKHVPDALLGKTGSVPFGYLMGFFLILLAAKGFWMAALVMPAYYYFELIYSTINQWLHRRYPEPPIFTFFISWVIRKNLNEKGLFPFLFLNMLGFALIGVVFNNSIQVILTLSLLLFIYTIYRLYHWGEPKITYRSMFHDTKDALSQVKSNLKESISTVSTYMKDKNKK